LWFCCAKVFHKKPTYKLRLNLALSVNNDMKKIIDRIWLLPILLALVVTFAFATVSMGLFPMPYYLSLAIPYLIVANIFLLVFVAIQHRSHLLKTILVSAVSLTLAYLWLIQTA